MKCNLLKTIGITLIFYITLSKVGIEFTVAESVLNGCSFGLVTSEV